MRVEYDRKLDFDDVLIRPKRTRLKTRADVDLVRTFKTPHCVSETSGVPIIAANMDSTGTLEMAAALAKHKVFTAIHKHYTLDQLVAADLNADYNFVSFGLVEDISGIKQTMDALKSKGINKICLDVANGYTEAFIDFVKKVRENHPDVLLMAGNVATPDMTEALIIAGADIIKIGIGPGSVCETRSVTGVGYPQLSAIIECGDAAHGVGGLICGDGGCRTSGDVSKAFGAGADFVMLGGMLAGHKECLSPEKQAELEENDFKVDYYGMSSTEAMNKYSGGVAKHRASEGRVATIEYKGPVEDTILAVLGGLRSTCTYVGASKLKELTKRTSFVVKYSK